MQYTVSSRGRPIGVTDLGFVRIGGPIRSGWFHPNEVGERLMPLITEALHHAGALGLTLHREDGSLVPTELMGIQDAERLLAAAQQDDLIDDAPCWHPDDDLDDDLDDDDDLEGEADLVPAFGAMSGDGETDAVGAWDTDEAWRPDDEPPAFPRYQIHVVLADPDAIP